MADLVQVSQVEFYKQRLEVNMSAILQGADKAYLKEYTESADEKRLYALQDAMGTVRKTTKGGKYLGSDVIDILVQVQQLAEKFGIPQDELDYFENQVRQAQNNLESAIYGLEEPFEDVIRDLQNRIDDSEVDEGMYDQEAFDNIFKDRKDKGSMEKPKSKPQDTGMYNQPNKADKDKEGEQLTEEQFDEAAGKKDACYHKVKARYDVWPSAYASGALVKCRKVGASNWGKTTTKEDEELDEAGTNCWKGYEKKGTKKMFGKTVNNCVKKESVEAVDEDLKAWFGKGKDGGAGGGGWDAYNSKGERTGKCGDSKGSAKPKCLSKSKAASLRSSGGKKAIGAAVNKKRRNDPNKDRKGKAKNVSSKTNESRIASSLRMVAEEYEREMEEGNGRLRGIAAGALLIGSLMGLNNKMAQEVYDNSHQLQQLTQIYQIAQERGDEEKMKDVKRRISNHKTRLDLGKGDVDFDGRPGNDDIKDIDYLNEPK